MSPLIPVKRCDGVGSGAVSTVHKVSSTIVVKVALNKSQILGWEAMQDPESKEERHPFSQEIKFYEALHQRQDRCSDIVECFVAISDFIFLSYCSLNTLHHRFREYQERELSPEGFPRALIRVAKYEDHGLVARWIQQVTSALEYVEKMGFCHNDLQFGNCLLDSNLNLKLSDFDRATTIGQFFESLAAPWAMLLDSGPLAGTHGLCSARTEQFAVGTLLYYMVYGHEPYDDMDFAETDPPEISRRFMNRQFPELNRHELFDGLISACWHNVYPNMALLAYDFKRKTKGIMASPSHNEPIDRAKGRRACETMIREGLLGDELARHYQPVWWRYIHDIMTRNVFLWEKLGNFLRKLFRTHIMPKPRT